MGKKNQVAAPERTMALMMTSIAVDADTAEPILTSLERLWYAVMFIAHSVLATRMLPLCL